MKKRRFVYEIEKATGSHIDSGNGNRNTGCGSSSGTAETTVKETTQAAATESTASAETESTAAKSLADYDKVDTFNAYMMV